VEEIKLRIGLRLRVDLEVQPTGWTLEATAQIERGGRYLFLAFVLVPPSLPH
jgi:hypothetical protein